MVAKGVVNGRSRGYLRLANGSYASDIGNEAGLTSTALRNLVTSSQTELTYSCVPVGSGRRIGIDGDCDDSLDGDDSNPDVPVNGLGCGAAPAVPAPAFTLTASPASITAGATSTLTWSAVSNATSCTAIGGWASNPSVAGGSQVISPATTTAYMLNCSGAGGSAVRAVTVTVQTTVPPTVDVNVTPRSITLGQSATLSWSTTNATSCSASGPLSGPRATSGSEIVTPASAGTYNYRLTCSGPGGTATDPSKLTVVGGSAPVVSISAAPAAIASGQASTLTWTSTGATSCTASGAWSGAKPISGSESLAPTVSGTTTYTLTCSGSGGSGNRSATVTVTAPVPTVSLAVNPGGITLGQSLTLNWSLTNASSCTASNAWSGAKANSGSETITPTAAGTLTYTLACNGAGGTASRSVTATVNPSTASKPVVNLGVSPRSIVLGQSASLTWTTTNATTCTASGPWSGSEVTAGNETVKPTATGSFNYVLTCSGPGGTTSDPSKLTVTR